VINGGSFEDGFKSSFTISALTYMNYSMRQAMIKHSLEEPNGMSDGSGKGVGFAGSDFKLAGAIYDSGRKGVLSWLGGLQADRNYYIFGRYLDTATPWGYAGAWVMEAFAGPHDTFNSKYWYNGMGAINVDMSNFERMFGETAFNYTSSLVLATPVENQWGQTRLILSGESIESDPHGTRLSL